MTRGVILPEESAKLIIAEIILSLKYLHSKNIVYRDMKPENILLDSNNHIRLIDFGLSKFQNPLDAVSLCGSPAYLSPEVLFNKPATFSSDIYGVGCILFEMLTGNPPFY